MIAATEKLPSLFFLTGVKFTLPPCRSTFFATRPSSAWPPTGKHTEAVARNNTKMVTTLAMKDAVNIAKIDRISSSIPATGNGLMKGFTAAALDRQKDNAAAIFDERRR
ncbi:hypothetical protein ACE10Z_41330 [Bradyrhizobium sp. Pha-3]|uniref:hypothetical protein n=1 Tax=Bradyrhizobium sp. Pha-3 TaxID=208375 RepID=UPI0035D50CA1